MARTSKQSIGGTTKKASPCCLSSAAASETGTLPRTRRRGRLLRVQHRQGGESLQAHAYIVAFGAASGAVSRAYDAEPLRGPDESCQLFFVLPTLLRRKASRSPDSSTTPKSSNYGAFVIGAGNLVKFGFTTATSEFELPIATPEFDMPSATPEFELPIAADRDARVRIVDRCRSRRQSSDCRSRRQSSDCRSLPIATLWLQAEAKGRGLWAHFAI